MTASTCHIDAAEFYDLVIVGAGASFSPLLSTFPRRIAQAHAVSLSPLD